MMKQRAGLLLLTLFLSACVTINIYFPAAEAKEAAEQIVDDILQSAPEGSINRQPAVDDKSGSLELGNPLVMLLDFLVPGAHAAEPNFSVNTPEIRRIQAGLKQRHGALAPHYRSGAIGFVEDGTVAVHHAKAISLKDRKRVEKLLVAENRDRNRLYRAIAKANGHPEWEKDVRAVFAKTWVDKAEKGWWYRKPGGQWAKK